MNIVFYQHILWASDFSFNGPKNSKYKIETCMYESFFEHPISSLLLIKKNSNNDDDADSVKKLLKIGTNLNGIQNILCCSKNVCLL